MAQLYFLPVAAINVQPSAQALSSQAWWMPGQNTASDCISHRHSAYKLNLIRLAARQLRFHQQLVCLHYGRPASAMRCGRYDLALLPCPPSMPDRLTNSAFSNKLPYVNP